MRRIGLTGLIAALATGCIVPIAIPPLRGEAAGSMFVGEHRAFHAAAGTAIASGTMSPGQPFDVGVGGFIDMTEHAGNTGGVYIDTAAFVDHGELTRTSVGVRGEVRIASASVGGGVKLRIDHEMFGGTTQEIASSDRCGEFRGMYYGSAAIGVYSEAGRVWQPDGMSAWTATAGITFRLPAVLGVWVGIPHC